MYGRNGYTSLQKMCSERRPHYTIVWHKRFSKTGIVSPLVHLLQPLSTCLILWWTRWLVCPMRLQFWSQPAQKCWCLSEWLATALAKIAVSSTCDCANASGTVTSQVRAFPLAQGISVASSGHLPSNRNRPTSSFTAGIWALLTSLHILSFRLECLWCLAALFQQERPCSPLASTVLCAVHTFLHYC